MKKSWCAGQVVRLNGAAFRLGAQDIQTGDLEALVDSVLAQVLGGNDESTNCVQYSCNLFAGGESA
ncbi:MAG TPA: hypothetical protein VEW48_28130 [Thermoanaerobaculia bacterium]|nr:hypothetical protein [Thermoanaerobaculia bacterium]